MRVLASDDALAISIEEHDASDGGDVGLWQAGHTYASVSPFMTRGMHGVTV